MNSDALATLSLPALPAPSPEAPAPLVCERCGGFSPELAPHFEKSVCEECLERMKERQRGIKLYPPGYLWAVGLLGNGAAASVLAALNWSRIGNQRRAKGAWAMAVGCMIVSAIAVSLPQGQLPITAFVSFLATQRATDGWKPIFDEHLAAGGKRASLLFPILVVALVVLAIAFALALVLPDV